MATPSESITTVNGRRCTRSRVRIAVTTSKAEEAQTSTQITTTTTTSQDPPQIQTSTAQASSNPPPPPPPPPPPSSQPPSPPPPPPVSPPAPSSAPASSADQAAQLPADGTTAPTDAVAGTSSTGTLSTVLISSSALVEPLALPSSNPPPAALEQPPAAQASVEVPLQAPEVPAAPSTSAIPSSPSPISTVPKPTPTVPSPTSAVPSPIPTTASDSISTAIPSPLVGVSEPPASSTASPASDAPAPVDPNAAIPLESDTTLPLSITAPGVGRTRPTASPAGGSAGIIAPDQGSSTDDGPLTLSRNGNIGGILGGVFGGIAAFALISGLLFLCLRKRRPQVVKWNEKRQEYPSFLEKVKSIPTGLGVFVAKLKGGQTGSARNTYQRHVPKASVDSVYSRDSNGRIRSNSEPQGVFGVKRAGSSGSITSRKSERNVLRKKPSSVSSYRFPDIAEDTGSPNPFVDPQQMRPLLLLNPDPKSAPGTPQVPAATADPEPRDPFTSVYDPPPVAPTWERGPAQTHQRAMSSVSGQSSLPTWSLYATDNPFRDPPNAPPPPNQAVLPQHQRRRSSMALPNFNPTTTFDANSTFATRDSGMYFGEPGPSRPATNMFTPVTPARRTIRQSDPFDLDRPEVLGFGGISRQPTRSKRTSNASTWYSTAGTGASTNPPLPTGNFKAQWGPTSGR